MPAYKDAVTNTKLSDGAVRLLTYLIQEANEQETVAHLRHTDIAKVFEWNPRTVANYISQLEGEGYLTQERRRRQAPRFVLKCAINNKKVEEQVESYETPQSEANLKAFFLEMKESFLDECKDTLENLFQEEIQLFGGRLLEDLEKKLRLSLPNIIKLNEENQNTKELKESPIQRDDKAADATDSVDREVHPDLKEEISDVESRENAVDLEGTGNLSNKEIVSMIKTYRKRHGLSQEEFGQLFDPILSRSSISGYENGRVPPREDVISKLISESDGSLE